MNNHHVHALDILGDPVRRRVLELLADGERSAGEVGEVVQREFGISQPAVSQHLKVLRDNGFTSVRAQGTRRLYAVAPERLQEVDVWVGQFRSFWTQRLDALATEVARGRRANPRNAARANTAHANGSTSTKRPARRKPATKEKP